MATKEPIVDHGQYDFSHVIADAEEIRRFNPQRFEMEQLTAIVYEDPEKKTCVGYKDVSDQEFWVRGHMPQVPLMPGVLICEAAAQLCSFYVAKLDMMPDQMVGFGGLHNVHFRGMVRPGDRLVIAVKLKRVRPGVIVVATFQAFVDEALVCDGEVRGVALPKELGAPFARPADAD